MAALLVYSLCFLTAMGCAAALYFGWRESRAPLLGWSAACFVGLAVNDGLVLVDVYVVPSTSLLILRTAVGLLGAVFLLFGLVFHGHGSAR